MHNILDKLSSSIGKSNIKIYTYNGLTAVIAVLFSLLAIKFVGLEEYGLFVLLTSFVGILLNVVGTRTSEAVTYFYRLNNSQKEDVIFSGYLFDFLVVCVFWLIIYIFSQQIGEIKFIDSIEPVSLIYYSFFLSVQILFGTSQGVWIAQNNYQKVSAVQFISALTRIIILLAVSFSSEVSHIELAICYSLSSIVFIPYIVLNFFKNKCYILKRKRIIKGFTKYSLKTFTSSLLKSGNKKIDNIIVGIFIDHNFLGVYDLCKKALSPITFIVNPLANIFASKFIDNYQKGLFSITKRIIYKSSFFIFLVQFFFLFFGCIIIFFFKADFYSGKINLFAIFLSTLITQSIVQQTWWCRPFSNAIEPNLSIYGNMILTASYFSIVYPASSFFGVTGFLYAMPISSALLYSYWFFILEKSSK